MKPYFQGEQCRCDQEEKNLPRAPGQIGRAQHSAPAWDMPQSHLTLHGLTGLAGLFITYGTSSFSNLLEMVAILRICGEKPSAEWESSSSLS